jgi:hypothetical protein
MASETLHRHRWRKKEWQLPSDRPATDTVSEPALSLPYLYSFWIMNGTCPYSKQHESCKHPHTIFVEEI